MTRLVLQSAGSRLCGQACVAMLLGTDLAGGVEAVGHSRGTYTRELTAALRRAGLKTDERARRKRTQGREGLYLARVRVPKHRWLHWVVVDAGLYFDPSTNDWPIGATVTSWVWVQRRDTPAVTSSATTGCA